MLVQVQVCSRLVDIGSDGVFLAYCILNELLGAPGFKQVAGIMDDHVTQSFIESDKKFSAYFRKRV